ncbi:MAG TPA: YwbE family protein [Terriglobia bacterium]|nr:YwbE family protein [Terriglobia bacterium]
MNGEQRANIRPGLRVRVVEKQNQSTGALTEGVVQKLLTKSPMHPHGIKVMLVGGVVGRVKQILDDRA